jgi:DNA-binding CsgD family transcriptional regulator
MIRLMQKVPDDNGTDATHGNEGGTAVQAPVKVQVKEPEPLEELPLTPAEARVFWEVIQGLTNKQISQRLFISPRTVQTHLSNILTKLNLENRSQLVRYAYEHGYKPTGQDNP